MQQPVDYRATAEAADPLIDSIDDLRETVPKLQEKVDAMMAAMMQFRRYVGMTGLDPDLRFDKHKAGIQANQFVFRFGLRLLPALYEVYNPMPYEAAREMEVELAIGLREAGYGVWQA